jgi:hypothetical protein
MLGLALCDEDMLCDVDALVLEVWEGLGLWLELCDMLVDPDSVALVVCDGLLVGVGDASHDAVKELESSLGDAD